MPIESPGSYKCSLRPNLVSATVFEISRIKGLWAWPFTSQGHTKWSPCALYIISVGSTVQHRNFGHSWHFMSKSMSLIFDHSRSSKVKSDGANRKPVGPTYKCLWLQQYLSVTVFEIVRVKWFWRWPLTSQGHPRSNLMVPIESP